MINQKELKELLVKLDNLRHHTVIPITINRLSDKDIRLNIVLKNLRNSTKIGLNIYDDNVLDSYQDKLLPDREDDYNRLAEIIKQVREILDEIFSNSRYEELTKIIKSNSFRFIGEQFPYHKKSLLKFDIIETGDCQTLSVQYNEDKNIIELKYNPIEYSKIILTEISIIYLKQDTINDLTLNSFSDLIKLYGAFLFIGKGENTRDFSRVMK